MMRFLSLGAGVQSSTLALQFAVGEFRERLDGAIFADTQNEPRSVYDWLVRLKEYIAQAPYSFPVHVVTAGNLGKEILRLRTSRKTGQRYIRALIPAFYGTAGGGRALFGRKCTAEYKVRALVAKQHELASIPRACKEVRVISYLGISYDEVHRMKPSVVPWAENQWPLVERKMTRADCLRWMHDHGYPRPPRSACVFCPFHSDAEWMRLRDEEPDEFARAVKFDEAFRRQAAQATGTAKVFGDVFLHSSLKPLSEVEFTQNPQLDLFGNECEGLCGV
jgi:hypothetical protein